MSYRGWNLGDLWASPVKPVFMNLFHFGVFTSMVMKTPNPDICFTSFYVRFPKMS